ncbi:hypothetical protein FB45DRAFT_1055366 [Roridomyces roridus]|uniref:Uncharacterized protein n=2 Tax=Roridomyces roridus TaxID=1738132 RepID=A0AAD7C550_9AGAR|nr:hypothetical protein FB45DRAFT_1055366 [Roridomyces roridus]
MSSSTSRSSSGRKITPTTKMLAAVGLRRAPVNRRTGTSTTTPTTPITPVSTGTPKMTAPQFRPGLVDKPKERRSSQEVQFEKQVKLQQKEQAEARRQDAISKAATIENRIERDDEIHAEQANRPPLVEMDKVLRPRPVVIAQGEGQSELLCRRAILIKSSAVASAGPVDQFSDGPGSSDEFQPGNEHEDDDELMDPSDDEGVVAKPKPRGKKSKGTVRKAVDAEKTRQGGGAEGKRKAESQEPQAKAATKKAKKSNLGGVYIDWSQRGRTPSTDFASSRAPSRSMSAGSALSRRASSELGVPESDASAIGGIDSDADDGEEGVSARPEEKAKDARQKPRHLLLFLLRASIAGIVETQAVGLVPLKALKSSGQLKKSDIKRDALPPALLPRFKSEFTPAVLNELGTRKGWTDLLPDDFVDIWNDLFPKYTVGVDDPSDANQVKVIVKLGQDKINAYRHKLATTAIASLENMLTTQKLDNPEAKAAEVQYQLQGDDAARIFYYESIIEIKPKGEDEGEDEDEKEQPTYKFKGVFQSKLCSRVLAVHCTMTSVNGIAGPHGFDPDLPHSYPIGALTYTIQALKRALNYYSTGQLVIPDGTLGHFSKTNWSDAPAKIEGQAVHVNSTTNIHNVLNQLQPIQWKKIIAAAQRAAAQRDQAEPSEDIMDVDADAAEAADSSEGSALVLIDQDSDVDA